MAGMSATTGMFCRECAQTTAGGCGAHGPMILTFPTHATPLEVVERVNDMLRAQPLRSPAVLSEPLTVSRVGVSPDQAVLSDFTEATSLRGRVVRAFFGLMRLWSVR